MVLADITIKIGLLIAVPFWLIATVLLVKTVRSSKTNRDASVAFGLACLIFGASFTEASYNSIFWMYIYLDVVGVCLVLFGAHLQKTQRSSR